MDPFRTPEYLAAAKTLKRFLPERTKKVLYHYTDLAAAMEIVRSGVLWATDIAYLNDPTELSYAQNLIDDVIARVCADADKHIRDDAELISKVLRASHKDVVVFFTSFSEKPNQLSQWVSYTPVGCRGVAVGFDAKACAATFDLRKVLYNPKHQEKALATIIKWFIDGLARAEHAGSKQLRDAVWGGLGTLLMQCLVFFKNPAYASESEWRAAHIWIGNREPELRVYHRAATTAIIPYVHFDLRTGRASTAIVDIVIGPGLNFDYVSRGFASLLKASSHASAELRASQVPFRDPR